MECIEAILNVFHEVIVIPLKKIQTKHKQKNPHQISSAWVTLEVDIYKILPYIFKTIQYHW